MHFKLASESPHAASKEQQNYLAFQRQGMTERVTVSKEKESRKKVNCNDKERQNERQCHKKKKFKQAEKKMVAKCILDQPVNHADSKENQMASYFNNRERQNEKQRQNIQKKETGTGRERKMVQECILD